MLGILAAQRNTKRPIRPNPLIPTLIDMLEREGSESEGRNDVGGEAGEAGNYDRHCRDHPPHIQLQLSEEHSNCNYGEEFIERPPATVVVKETRLEKTHREDWRSKEGHSKVIDITKFLIFLRRSFDSAKSLLMTFRFPRSRRLFGIRCWHSLSCRP